MKLEIESIEFRNLFSFGNKWQKFEPSGICFITGLNLNNNRRNFTGKSNLLKIFPYLLFGRVEGLNKGRIVNWRNRSNAEGIVKLRKGDTEYAIHRGIKPDILEVYENGRKLPEPSNKKDFQKQIENEILEKNYNSFMSVEYGDINSAQSILKMSRPAKRQFLEEMFFIEYYTKLKDAANKKLNTLLSKISDIGSEIKQNNITINQLKEQIEQFENDRKKISDSSKELEDKRKSLELVIDEYKDIVNNNLVEVYENKRNELEESSQRINEIQTNIKNKIKELQKFVKNTDTTSEIKSEETEKNIEVLSKQINDYTEQLKILETYISDSNSSEEELSRQAEEMNSKYYRLESKINGEENYLSEIEEKIDNPINEETCPFCYQKIDHDLIEDHLIKERDVYKKSIEDKEFKLNTLYNDSVSIRGVINRIKYTRIRISAIQNFLQKNQPQYDKLINRLEEVKKKEEQKKKVNKYQIVIYKLSNSKERLFEKNKKIVEEKDKVQEKKKQCENIINEYTVKSNEVERIKSKVENEKEEKDRVQQWINNNNEKINELTEKMKSDRKEEKRLKNIQDYIETIKDLCGDEKAKQYTIGNKIPVLNDRTNHYLANAGVNYYVKLNSWLDVEIRGPGIKDCIYENLSGAEKVSLDRSLQFAFNDLSRVQSPTHTDILILDEILDSSIDLDGIYNIMGIVERKQQSDGSKVLIVSHREPLEEMESIINNYYQVQFDGSYSKLVKL